MMFPERGVEGRGTGEGDGEGETERRDWTESGCRATATMELSGMILPSPMWICVEGFTTPTVPSSSRPSSVVNLSSCIEHVACPVRVASSHHTSGGLRLSCGG
mmetsp:Transcript_6498/g.6721  ORF Transcript_6498/g.6721 Transcript_6498/m.6721 type:complete len:103 (+) Transcript_6498:305-613(+)